MYTVRIEAPGHVAVTTVRRARTLESTDAVLRVTTAAIGPRDIARHMGRAFAPPEVTPGSEFAGVIEEVGADVHEFDLGDLVTVAPAFRAPGSVNGDEWNVFGFDGLPGGQSGWVRVPWADATLVRIPDPAIEERALLLGETYGLAASAVHAAEAAAGGTYAVVGCDPRGISCIVALSRREAGMVLALDSDRSRLAVARRMDAATVDLNDDDWLSAVLDLTSGAGPSAVILGSLDEGADQDVAIALARPSGRIILTDPQCPGSPEMDWAPALEVPPYRACPPSNSEIRRHMLDLWAGRIDLEPLVSHVMSVEDAPLAYEAILDPGQRTRRVLLKF